MNVFFRARESHFLRRLFLVAFVNTRAFKRKSSKVRTTVSAVETRGGSIFIRLQVRARASGEKATLVTLRPQKIDETWLRLKFQIPSLALFLSFSRSLQLDSGLTIFKRCLLKHTLIRLSSRLPPVARHRLWSPTHHNPILSRANKIWNERKENRK